MKLLQIKEHVGKFKDSLSKTWIGVARHVVLEEEVGDWLIDARDLDREVAVHQLSSVQLWIVLAMVEDRRKPSLEGCNFGQGSLKRLNKWQETLGPVQWLIR